MTDLARYYDQSYPPQVWAGTPVLTGINPTTGPLGTQVTIQANGSDFDPSSKLVFDGVAWPTLYVGAGVIRGTGTPTGQARTVQVRVNTGSLASGSSPFIITAAGGQQEEPPPDDDECPPDDDEETP